MPCVTDITPEERAESEAKAREKLVAPYKAETDRVTALLCGLLTKLADVGVLRQYKSKGRNPEYKLHLGEDPNTRGQNIVTLDQYLADWWTAHKRKDEERKEAEVRQQRAAKKAAWDKLTDADLELMGLTRPPLRD